MRFQFQTLATRELIISSYAPANFRVCMLNQHHISEIIFFFDGGGGGGG